MYVTRPVYKPHSVRQGYLPRRPSILARRLRLALAAYPELIGDEPPPWANCPFVPAWPCSRWGLPGRACCQARRWSLTPPFHPYRHDLPEEVDSGGLFLWPDPAGNRSMTGPHPGCYPASRSVECGLSSAPLQGWSAIARPTWYNHHTIITAWSQLRKFSCRPF